MTFELKVKPFPTLLESALRIEYQRQMNELLHKIAQAGYTVDVVTRNGTLLAMGNYTQYATVHYANQLYRRTS